MRTVRLAFSPMPAHVRTARLVAVATAREAGVEEGVLDEIRSAVGEACARAVGLHRDHGRSDHVVVEFASGTRFRVTVRDTAPADRTAAGFNADSPFGKAALIAAVPFVVGGFPEEASFSEEAVAAGVGLALLTGLVDDVSVTTAVDGLGTVVEMSWPLV